MNNIHPKFGMSVPINHPLVMRGKAESSVPPLVRSIRGPRGEIITREHLPDPGARWMPRRKAIVVAAVWGGIISQDEVCQRYAITVGEFRRWQELIEMKGLHGLRTTYETKMPRVVANRGSLAKGVTELMEIGDIVIDTKQYCVIKGDEVVYIHRPQMRILELLIAWRGNMVTRTMILDYLYGRLATPHPKIIDTFVSKLRKKLAEVDTRVYISTSYGRGYTVEVRSTAK